MQRCIGHKIWEMEKNKILDRAGISGDDRLTLAKILDKMGQAERKNIPVATDFLSPREQAMSSDVLHLTGWPENQTMFWGGADAAERKVLLFLPDWLSPAYATDEVPLRVIHCTFRPEFHLSHRDFLGALMGLGVVREKVGDIYVGQDQCDLIVLDTVCEFLLQNFDQAGRAKLQVTEIDIGTLEIPETKCEIVRDTVMSLRLDSVASGGFKLSRTKAASLIQGGRVQVNWRDCVKPDRLLVKGDLISARGYGKIELYEVGGVSRKGRTAIQIKRYL